MREYLKPLVNIHLLPAVAHVRCITSTPFARPSPNRRRRGFANVWRRTVHNWINQIRDVNSHYRIFGETGPWVVLITGGRRGFNEFISFAEKIAIKGFQVLLHDRRNTGASDVLITGQDGEEEIWADDLAILADELGASSAFIGGISSGARLSMLYNQRHPDKVWYSPISVDNYLSPNWSGEGD